MTTSTPLVPADINTDDESIDDTPTPPSNGKKFMRWAKRMVFLWYLLAVFALTTLVLQIGVPATSDGFNKYAYAPFMAVVVLIYTIAVMIWPAIVAFQKRKQFQLRAVLAAAVIVVALIVSLIWLSITSSTGDLSWFIDSGKKLWMVNGLLGPIGLFLFGAAAYMLAGYPSIDQDLVDLKATVIEDAVKVTEAEKAAADAMPPVTAAQAEEKRLKDAYEPIGTTVKNLAEKITEADLAYATVKAETVSTVERELQGKKDQRSDIPEAIKQKRLEQTKLTSELNAENLAIEKVLRDKENAAKRTPPVELPEPSLGVQAHLTNRLAETTAELTALEEQLTTLEAEITTLEADLKTASSAAETGPEKLLVDDLKAQHVIASAAEVTARKAQEDATTHLDTVTATQSQLAGVHDVLNTALTNKKAAIATADKAHAKHWRDYVFVTVFLPGILLAFAYYFDLTWLGSVWS